MVKDLSIFHITSNFLGVKAATIIDANLSHGIVAGNVRKAWSGSTRAEIANTAANLAMVMVRKALPFLTGNLGFLKAKLLIQGNQNNSVNELVDASTDTLF